MTGIEPFRVDVSDEDIDDLRARLDATRWLDQIPDTTWEYGMNTAWLRELCRYWRREYDWRAAETALNRWPQFVGTFDGLRIHFYWVRSPEAAATPLVLMHGWPSCSAEFLEVVEPLANPRSRGGDPADAFDVVVPSLPGFGFSGPTDRRGVDGVAIARAIARLMSRLGYDRYVAQGGDIGAGVAGLLTHLDAEHLAAAHINLLPVGPPDPADPTAGLGEGDIARLTATHAVLDDGAGYWRIQETRPQTVAQGLNDSPAGLCGWIVEKFREWTDVDIDDAFTRDQLLTNVSIYWFTRTIGSSARFYFETRASGGVSSGGGSRTSAVPVGHADYPGEHYKMPRSWAERAYNLVRWKTHPVGGHFPALQVPDSFVHEIRAFVRDHGD